MRIRQDWQLYLFLLPATIYFFIFAYLPMYGIQVAFRDYSPGRGITGSPWVGLEHFQRFFTSNQFGTVLLNSLELSLYSLLVCFPLPIIFALMITQIGITQTGPVWKSFLYWLAGRGGTHAICTKQNACCDCRAKSGKAGRARGSGSDKIHSGAYFSGKKNS